MISLDRNQKRATKPKCYCSQHERLTANGGFSVTNSLESHPSAECTFRAVVPYRHDGENLMCLPVEKKTTLELEHNEATYKDSKALQGFVVSGCSPHHRDIMSAQDAPSAAEIITIVSTSFTLNYIEFPVITFLAYEYLITLDQEIKLFWKRGFTGASALFLFVRYSTLICYDILGAISFARLSDDSCALIIKAQAGFTIFQYFPWAAFSALRVLALSGMNRPLAALVFLLASAPAAANFTQYRFKLTGLNTPLAGCQGQIDATQQQVEILVVVSRVGLILADIIGVAVTVAKTRQGAKAPHLGGSQRSLGNVLLYDGLIYFAALLCFNVLDLALSVIAFVTPINSGSYVTALTDPLTAVLVCRFLLDLQAANVSSMHDSHAFESVDHHTAGVGSLVFARVIGSMGAPLGPDHTTTDSTLEEESGEQGCSMSLSSMHPPAGEIRDIEEVPASG